MSESTSTKRTARAATKSVIIEISESEEDEPQKKKRCLNMSEDVWEPEVKKAKAKVPATLKVTKKATRVPAKSRRKNDTENTSKQMSHSEFEEEIKAGTSSVTVSNPIKTDKSVVGDVPYGNDEKKRKQTVRKPKQKENVQMKEDEFEMDNKSTSTVSSQVSMEWEEAELLAEREGIDMWVARNLTNLFDNDNTIPFIARYRKELTRHMEPEQLRHAKDTYEEIRQVKLKAASVLQKVEKLGKLTPQVEKTVLCARSMGELEHISAPFKTGSKRTYAERARQLGLESAALALLEGSEIVDPTFFINTEKDGLHTESEVNLGIQHIIADIISKDREILDFINVFKRDAPIRLESSRAKGSSRVKEVIKGSKKAKIEEKSTSNKAAKCKQQAIADEESKFRNYFEFSMNTRYIKPHQILAINRGESQKELTVRVVVPETILPRLLQLCQKRWLSRGLQYQLRQSLFELSIKDAFTRLIQPLIVRQVRAELNQEAERASVEVFATNLKKLLLMPPFRGHSILGIDPGFRNGCKAAVISTSGTVLETGVLYLHVGKQPQSIHEDHNASWLKSVLTRHRCEVIAVGNGTACRQTEEYLSNLIQQGWFRPELDVSYTIITEQGASIYSCSEEAKKEFPDMDPNLISAVSLARRLQDPLTEFVKVEPKHMGVGMYQHDISEKLLSNTLNEVVVECVSFVGIDLNTASHCLLRRIAGLNSARADKIIEYRKVKGRFTSREQIKKIKGIGEKSFEQCAGFIRILPETAIIEDKNVKCNPLDRTWIHPESYDFAMRFIKHCGASFKDFGSEHFNRSIQSAIQTAGGVAALAEELGKDEPLVKMVSEGLILPPNHDFRSEFQKPLFRKGMTSIEELKSGDILTGRVTNSTHFGAFVDVGVGRDGLIHVRFMRNLTPHVGDKVEVKVTSYEKARNRLALELLAIL